MDTIRELEIKLEEEKLRKAWNESQELFKTTTQKYLDKAWGNHALRYNGISKYNTFSIEAVFIKDVYFGLSENHKITTFEEYKINKNLDPKVVVIGESLSIYKWKEGTLDIRIGTYRSVIGERGYPNISDYNHEIKTETYYKLKKLFSQTIDCILLTKFKDLTLDTTPDNLECTKVLKNNGCKLVVLDNSEVYAIKNHPFLYGNELLVTDLSKKIIEDMIKTEEDLEKRDTGFWCGSEYVGPSGYHTRELEQLRSILKKCL